MSKMKKLPVKIICPGCKRIVEGIPVPGGDGTAFYGEYHCDDKGDECRGRQIPTANISKRSIRKTTKKE